MLQNILKTTFRSFYKGFAHSTLNILGLALGLTTVFLILVWIGHHKRYDRFHSHGDSIYKLVTHSSDDNGELKTTTGALYGVMTEAKNTIPQIEKMTRYTSSWRWPSEQCFKIDPTEPCIYNKGMFVDSSFMEVFDFKIIHGNYNPLAKDRSLVLTKSLSSKLFGDENPVGVPYKLGNHLEVTITGVIDDLPGTSTFQFDFLAGLDVFYALRFGDRASKSAIEEAIKYNTYNTYIELNTNEIDRVKERLNELESAQSHESLTFDVQPLFDQHLYTKFYNGVASGGLIDYLKLFFLFAVFILLISSINFINLSTSKSALRSKEIGIRKVTGATKIMIIFQFMAESFIKVMIAILIALFLTSQLLNYSDIFIGERLVLVFDTTTWVTLFIVAVFTILLSGAYPAFFMSSFSPIKALKSKEGINRNGSIGLRRWLTIFQVLASVVIILVTTVIHLQLNYLQNKDLGYDKEGVMLLDPTYSHIKQYDAFKNALISHHQIKAIAVSDANITQVSNFLDNLQWPGKQEDNKVMFNLIGADAGFTEVLNLDIIEGSNFFMADSLNEILITEDAVRAMSLDDPIGLELTLNGEKTTVVGVLKNFNTQSLENNRMPVIIRKINPYQSGTVYIKYDKNSTKEAIEKINNEYTAIEKFFSMKFKMLDEEYNEKYKSINMTSSLSLTVTVISAIISLIGIFGLATYNVIRRFKEIGIRKVFGASVSQVIKLMSSDFMKITLVANFLAWPIAYYIIHNWLDKFAYKINFPYYLFIITILTSLTIVFIVVLSQSFKAALTNPTKVIREE